MLEILTKVQTGLSKLETIADLLVQIRNLLQENNNNNNSKKKGKKRDR